MSELDEPERWLAVPGFPNYQVSDGPRVYSIPRNGKGGRYLNPWLDDRGYLHVTLYHNGVAKKPYLHQVVAAAFLEPRPPGQEVCHGPNGKLDNRPGNLSYGPHSKNVGPDKFRDGTFLTGDDHQNSKLTVAIVGECRRRAATGGTHQALADEFGVNQVTMTAAISGETWQECTVPPVRGRRHGEQHQDAKLTEAIIRECHARRAAGETLQALAREFGVSRPSLYYALTGKTWKHLNL